MGKYIFSSFLGFMVLWMVGSSFAQNSISDLNPQPQYSGAPQSQPPDSAPQAGDIPPPSMEALPPGFENSAPAAADNSAPQVMKPTSEPPPQIMQPLPPVSSPRNAPAADAEIPKFVNPEGYTYDPTGRRDPFKPFGESQATQAPEISQEPTQSQDPLQMYDVSQFKLVGIIWQVNDPKAMVRDPGNKLHLIRRQTKIGRNNGFVATIREGEVIVVEPSVGENGMQTAITRAMILTR